MICDRNMVQNISKNLSSKYSQNLLDYPKQSATDVLNPIRHGFFWLVYPIAYIGAIYLFLVSHCYA